MFKGIWNRSSSSNGNNAGINQAKNENIDASNFANRGQSMDISGHSKIGMGTCHLNMPETGDGPGGDGRRYRCPQISKVACQGPVNNSKKPGGKGGDVVVMDQATGIGQLSSQHT